MRSPKTPLRFVVNHKGRRLAVILCLREYERLLEDLHDLATIVDRRDEVAIDDAELRRRLTDAPPRSAAPVSSPPE